LNPELVRLEALGGVAPEANSEGAQGLEDQSARISYRRDVLHKLAAHLERNTERLKPSSRVNNLANKVFSPEARVTRELLLPICLSVPLVARNVASR